MTKQKRNSNYDEKKMERRLGGQIAYLGRVQTEPRDKAEEERRIFGTSLFHESSSVGVASPLIFYQPILLVLRMLTLTRGGTLLDDGRVANLHMILLFKGT